MSSERRGGLGRGLGALIPAGEDTAAKTGPVMKEVAINAIQANPRQPRTVFDDDELDGLAASIREVGLLQPIVARSLPDGRWELVAGERRLRAARRAGLRTIAVIVRDTDDADLLKEALIENIHRVQLNPLEEAAAYGQLLDDFGVTQEELARRLGKGRPTISNALRLLSLPPGIQRRVAAGVLTAGHAKALLGLSTPHDQEQVAERIVNEGLSVRATEELVRMRYLEDPAPSPRLSSRGQPLPPSMEHLQDDLATALGQDVRIRMGKRKGTLAIAFRTPEDLTHLIEVIARGLHDPAGPDDSHDLPHGEEHRPDMATDSDLAAHSDVAARPDVAAHSDVAARPDMVAAATPDPAASGVDLPGADGANPEGFGHHDGTTQS